MARWATKPISTFHASFAPVVLGPNEIPKTEHIEDAMRSPFLAVLSAIVHAKGPKNEAVVLNALAALQPLATETRDYYTDLIVSVVGRATLESWMPQPGWEFQSWLYKDRIAEAEARGEAKAAAGVMRRSLRAVLDARGIALSAEGAARIDACIQVEVLERWLRAAVTASAESELW